MSIEPPTTYDIIINTAAGIHAHQDFNAFYRGILFATGCYTPHWVDVPARHSHGNTGNLDELFPSAWLTPSAAPSTEPFDFDHRSRTINARERRVVPDAIVLMYVDQPPDAAGYPGEPHAPNELVSAMCGRLPLKWIGNVLAVKVLKEGGFGDLAEHELVDVREAIKGPIRFNLTHRAFRLLH
ncbi:hypothetical protein C8R44DRAFT_893571 [Mycena epipterygia]|nr:hypothetical protein C8R44DRAFT_893571 [Mycena epipterygia]